HPAVTPAGQVPIGNELGTMTPGLSWYVCQMCSASLPVYVADKSRPAPNCLWTARFQACTPVVFRSGRSARNEPKLVKGAFLSSVYGKMFPPGTVAQGSSKLTGPVILVKLPNGGASVVVAKNWAFTKSYESP